MDHFNQYADRYRLAVLRADYPLASNMIDPAKRSTMDFEKMKEIKIVDYKVTGVISTENDKDEIRQDVVLQYYYKSQNILRSVQYQQLWVYKADGRAWLLETDLPKFER